MKPRCATAQPTISSVLPYITTGTVHGNSYGTRARRRSAVSRNRSIGPA
ncbi:Uncharacterised protein [Mycobacteroides abscessus subsp. abscessus]|nr:Uncharacterised protein [Mycobacteroides abscessus subsp. abscessus]